MTRRDIAAEREPLTIEEFLAVLPRAAGLLVDLLYRNGGWTADAKVRAAAMAIYHAKWHVVYPVGRTVRRSPVLRLWGGGPRGSRFAIGSGFHLIHGEEGGGAAESRAAKRLQQRIAAPGTVPPGGRSFRRTPRRAPSAALTRTVDPEIYTAADVQKILKVGRDRAREIVRQIGVPIGPRTHRVTRERFEDWVATHQGGIYGEGA